jgi:hypothetical protein
MLKKPFKRIRRKDPLTPEEVARDREIRRKVQEEFPPLEVTPAEPLLSAPLREAILHSGKSVRWIAKHAKVSEIVLHQFMYGKHDLRLATAERLAHLLGLKLVANR